MNEVGSTQFYFLLLLWLGNVCCHKNMLTVVICGALDTHVLLFVWENARRVSGHLSDKGFTHTGDFTVQD